MNSPFLNFEGVVAPLDRANIDTDAIIPKQFMKSISRTGFGDNLFDEWRYLDQGEPGKDCTTRTENPEFVLNQPRYRGAEILVARDNFGCGSSREHAVWALRDFGFRALVAPSFADIFSRNCLKNGILPIVLEREVVEHMLEQSLRIEGYRLKVDLAEQIVASSDGRVFLFEIDTEAKHRLAHGLDDIGITLNSAQRIRNYEAWRREQEPWLFGIPPP
jgi:3-isopropylmalate/(R)-2-methylmalate dehydratase small subunit